MPLLLLSIADILQRQGMQVRGFLDNDPAIWNTHVLGLPVMGGIDRWSEIQFDKLFLAIGSNEARRQVAEELGDCSDDFWINAIHPTASIAAGVQLGCGVMVGAQAVISPDATVGNHVIVNTASTVGHDSIVGDYCHVGPGVILAGGTKVGTGAFLGGGATTIPQREIGEWATVGAGATVIHNIPPRVIAKGTPARW